MDQKITPLFDALKKHVNDKVIPFHVPGHKHGRGLPELVNYLGHRVFQMDVNGMRDLDYLNNPSGVIRESQELFADAFGASEAYMLVNGTTSGVQAMIMSCCEPGTEIILPRNAHKSTIGAIILSGAIPVYVQPEIHRTLGISMGVTVENIQKAIEEHPRARAVFLINPTYYGISSDLKSIVQLAHQYNMAVLVDEAHGAHMYFHPDFPMTAMQAGADMSAASIHKTGGSLTQSSVLLTKSNLISPEKVKQALNLTCTCSASYLLMCSLDLARKQLALHGKELLQNILEMARWAREQLNEIPGLYAWGNELKGLPGCHDFDESKLGIHVLYLGYTGYEMENVLREQYNIQMELADLHNILAVLSIGDQIQALEALISAQQELAQENKREEFKHPILCPCCPEMIVSPREAYYSAKKSLPLEECVGEIAGEIIMAYPPGIPVILPGERMSMDIVEYIKVLTEEKCELQGTADPQINYITVLSSSFTE